MAIEGLERALQQMRDFAEGVREGQRQAAEQEAEAVKVRSQQLVPVGEGPTAGRLRDSATVTVEQRGDVVTAAVTYTGREALEVHERLDVHHERGQAKFLEQATNEARPGMGERIGAAAVAAGKRRAGIS